jgi:hypothetical protein
MLESHQWKDCCPSKERTPWYWTKWQFSSCRVVWYSTLLEMVTITNVNFLPVTITILTLWCTRKQNTSPGHDSRDLLT